MLFFNKRKKSMLEWVKLERGSQLQEIEDASKHGPVDIFKHSVRCGVSFAVKRRIERRWDIPSGRLKVYYLDLLARPALSDEIASRFKVRHQSPQMLILRDGRVVFHASHGEIPVDAVRQVIGVDQEEMESKS